MLVRCIFFVIAMVILSSCNDHLKIEANNNPQGYADSQVVGTWKITAVTSSAPFDWDGNGVAETDVYSVWTPCQKDNLYIFLGNKTGTFRLNCNENLPGSWLIYNVQQLQYTPDGMSTLVEQFISMTSNEFKTTRNETVGPGQTITLTKTWTRQ